LPNPDFHRQELPSFAWRTHYDHLFELGSAARVREAGHFRLEAKNTWSVTATSSTSASTSS